MRAIGRTDNGQSERIHDFTEPDFFASNPFFHGFFRVGRGEISHFFQHFDQFLHEHRSFFFPAFLHALFIVSLRGVIEILG